MDNYDMISRSVSHFTRNVQKWNNLSAPNTKRSEICETACLMRWKKKKHGVNLSFLIYNTVTGQVG